MDNLIYISFICCACNYGYNEDWLINKNDKIVVCPKCKTKYIKNGFGGYGEV